MEWLAFFLGGLLGSSHCVGMCGSFALALGASGRGFRANLLRQIVYSLGRVFTYAVGGAAAGYAGWSLVKQLPFVNVQAWLSIAAGVLLIVMGLDAAGLLRRPKLVEGNRPCLGPKFFAALLGATRMHSVFLGGMVNGLLPCGLVYGFLTQAASGGDVLLGAAGMVLFGLGTLPVMVLIGVGGNVLSLSLRRRIFLVAAFCVVLTGVLSIYRGVGFLQQPSGPAEKPACPMCSEEETMNDE